MVAQSNLRPIGSEYLLAEDLLQFFPSNSIIKFYWNPMKLFFHLISRFIKVSIFHYSLSRNIPELYYYFFLILGLLPFKQVSISLRVNEISVVLRENKGDEKGF